MSDTGRLHDLLPWFANGTLAPTESRAFESHLDDCPACRQDLTWVSKMRVELDQHGATLLEEHPDPDTLVGVVRGEFDAGRSAPVRRHLALCPTCELEARWVAGDAVVEHRAALPSAAESQTFWKRHAEWGWAAAACALLALTAALFASRPPGTEPSGALFKPAVVVPTLLAEARQNTFELRPGDAGLQLVLELDLPPDAFPAEVEIVGATGNSLRRFPAVDRADLIGNLYLVVPCPRSECGPGSYSAHIRPVGVGEELEFRFVVVEAPDVRR